MAGIAGAVDDHRLFQVHTASVEHHDDAAHHQARGANEQQGDGQVDERNGAGQSGLGQKAGRGQDQCGNKHAANNGQHGRCAHVAQDGAVHAHADKDGETHHQGDGDDGDVFIEKLGVKGAEPQEGGGVEGGNNSDGVVNQ